MKEQNNLKRIGVIDIGTNSTRFYISEIEKGEKINKILKSFLKEVEITSLGKGVNENRELSKDGIERVVKAVLKFKEIAKKNGVDEIRAYGTSAVRDSNNKDELIDRLKDIDVIMECIDGETEAKLSFIGISSECNHEQIGVVDIGGGSTEITFGRGEEIYYSKSFNVGAVRATEIFFQKKIDEVGKVIEDYSNENLLKCREWIKKELQELENIKIPYTTLYGVAGTISKQVTIKEKMEKYVPEDINGYILSLDIIRDNYRFLKDKTLEERRKIKGLEPKRAEYVIAGTLILLVILEDILKVNEIKFSEVDNLEGATIYLIK